MALLRSNKALPKLVRHEIVTVHTHTDYGQPVEMKGRVATGLYDGPTAGGRYWIDYLRSMQGGRLGEWVNREDIGHKLVRHRYSKHARSR
jgi:hypothetical protein